jgi:UDP-3-O-[3-hydroxymyristoyl] N-acetylglucosamine deacetylase
MAFTSQTTLAQRVEVTGIGIHSGKPASLILHPAEGDRFSPHWVARRQ